MRTVRTTIQPHKLLTVGDAEYTDLSRQGLLLDETPTPAKPTLTPKPPAAAPAKKES